MKESNFKRKLKKLVRLYFANLVGAYRQVRFEPKRIDWEFCG